MDNKLLEGALRIISSYQIDSNKGYTRDNVVITLGVVNLMKRDLKINEFIELCSQVVNHFNNK